MRAAYEEEPPHRLEEHDIRVRQGHASTLDLLPLVFTKPALHRGVRQVNDKRPGDRLCKGVCIHSLARLENDSLDGASAGKNPFAALVHRGEGVGEGGLRDGELLGRLVVGLAVPGWVLGVVEGARVVIELLVGESTSLRLSVRTCNIAPGDYNAPW